MFVLFLYFFSEVPLRVFHHCFFYCFYFNYCCTGVFIVDCFSWCHQPFYPCCFFCCFFFFFFNFCVVVLWLLWIGEIFFYPQPFFTLNSYPAFGASTTATCLYQGFPGSWQFFSEGCRASYCGSKHRSNPSVCLNYTVFSKRYYLVGSIYVLRPAVEHYINLLLVLNPLFIATYVVSCMSNPLGYRSFKLIMVYKHIYVLFING